MRIQRSTFYIVLYITQGTHQTNTNNDVYIYIIMVPTQQN